MNHVAKTPLLYILLGFVGGIAIARNAEPMAAPATSAVILSMLVGGFILWRAGYKGKAEAVATAVATAVAQANAHADARAQAVATQAVQIVLQRDGQAVPMLHGSRIDPAIENAFQSVIDSQQDFSDDFDGSLDVMRERA